MTRNTIVRGSVTTLFERLAHRRANASPMRCVRARVEVIRRELTYVTHDEHRAGPATESEAHMRSSRTVVTEADDDYAEGGLRRRRVIR